MQKIIIYTKKTCPYCDMAKALLAKFGVTEYHEIKIDEDISKIDEMITLTQRKTVPQIFIGKFHVGGYDDLVKLHQDGKLLNLLQTND